MKKEVVIPEGTTIEVKKNIIKVKGPQGEISKEFHLEKFVIKQENGKLVIEIENPRRKEKAYLGTITAHIKNMIHGVNNKFTYKMKIVYKHFPINVSVEGDKLVIKNFLGEKKPRYAKILEGTDVKVKGDIIEISNIDKEKAGQTAANIERATKVRKLDVRIFQDGIFIVSKGGGE